MEVFEIGTIDISAAKGDEALLGDLDGDGRMELLVVQADSDIDDRYVPHQVTCLTAYRLTGEILWQIGTPLAKSGGRGADYPVQIHDIDGDGALEVLCIMNGKFLILDGKSGALKEQHDLPDEEAHDCIIIANLSGNAYPSDIILKNRYRKMWALNRQWKLLWTHKGNIGHFPLVYDINGDGYDEVMAGYDLLDCKGKRLWSCKKLDDHADCLWIGDVNGDGKPEIAVGGSVTCLYSADGKELWRYDGSVESQHIALGKFCPDEPGLQVAGLDRIVRGDGYKGQWDGKDGMFLLDCEGKEIWKEDRKTKGWLTIVDALYNWNGEGIDYILAYRRGGGVMPALYNGRMETVVTFPNEGYVLHGDLFGRGREDVIVYSKETAWIYSGTAYDLSQTPSGKAVPQNRKLRSATLYPGSVRE